MVLINWEKLSDYDVCINKHPVARHMIASALNRKIKH